MKPYQDKNTGVWNGHEVKTRTEFIECLLYDNDGNAYPATVELEVSDFLVEVVKFECKQADYIGVELNNPMDDIQDAIKNEGYKSQEIKF